MSSGYPPADATLPKGERPPVRLRMQLGPAIGQVYTMAGDTLTMGRAQDNDIVLDDPQVSRHHAHVVRRGDEIVVEDLGSTNGTLVNGRRITGPHVLQPTETIAVGASVFSVEGFAAPTTLGLPPYRGGPARPPGPPSQPPSPASVPSQAKAEAAPWLAMGWVGGLLIVVVIILTLAGLTAWLLTRNQGQVTPTVPSVFIQAPVAGSQVPVNQPVLVNATANDPNGVTRAELWVGGNVVDQQQSAVAEGQPSFPVSLHWTPTVAGGYTLEVRAYNSLGAVSAPTTVMINVVSGQQAVNTATPTPPGGSATPPGTPVAVTTSDLYVREGPGQDYPPLGLLPVNTQVEISGKNADGSWWQIVYPPGSDGRGWTYAPFTRASNTENVPVVPTPVPPTPTHTPTITPTATASPTSIPTPTSTPTAMPSPTPTLPAGPIVEFGATKTVISPGESTTLQWHIEHVNAAYLSGGEFSNLGVTGPLGSIEARPTSTTLYILRAETAAGPVERSVTVTVRGDQTATLNHVGGGTVREDGAVLTPQSVAGDDDTNRGLRAFFAFDLSSLTGAQIIQAQLYLSDYDRAGEPFEWLDPLVVEEQDWGSTLDGADYAAPAATLANLNDLEDLQDPVDVTGRVASRVASGGNSYRIRLRFETATNGNGIKDSTDWASSKARLVVRYYR